MFFNKGIICIDFFCLQYLFKIINLVDPSLQLFASAEMCIWIILQKYYSFECDDFGDFCENTNFSVHLLWR